MGRMIGIDLGTTNSVVGIVEGLRPRILDNKDGKDQTPSVVSLRKNRKKGSMPEELLIGETALDNFPAAPLDTILSIKRLMGRGFADAEVQRMMGIRDPDGKRRYLYRIAAPEEGTSDSLRVFLGDRPYSAPEISAMVLQRMKGDAEFRLGEEVTHAVITVPAYFTDAQKVATRQAAHLAGLKVIQLLDEPTAAAIAYGIDAEDDSEHSKTLLVYDLGGGTFDISVLVIYRGTFAPLALEGDMWLGGDDLHAVLVDHVIDCLPVEYGVDLATQPEKTRFRFQAALTRAAQRAKETLSTATSAHIVVPGLLRDEDDDLVDIEETIRRDQYEAMIQSLVERTLELTRKALDEASLTPEDVDHVLMAGGSSMVPRIQQAMEHFFGAHKLRRKMHPKHCVALGAALVASRIGERLVCPAPGCGQINDSAARSCVQCGTALAFPSETDARQEGSDALHVGGIAPFHYGILDAEDRFHVFVNKNDPYPTDEPVAREFRTRMPGQRIVSLPYYGRPRVDSPVDAEKQGEAFTMLPPDLPKGTRYWVKLGLDGEGIMGEPHMALERGRRLRTLITRGEDDAKAVKMLERMELVAGEKAAVATPEERVALEDARLRVFDSLMRRQEQGMGGALAEAERVLEMARSIGDLSIRQKADNASSNLAYILETYTSLIPNPLHVQLAALVSEIRADLDSGQSANLAAKIERVNAGIALLPEVVIMLFSIKARIVSTVQTMDRTRAQDLLRELDALDESLKRGEMSAAARVNDILSRALKAIDEAESQRQGLRQTACPYCGSANPTGAFRCDRCDKSLVGA